MNTMGSTAGIKQDAVVAKPAESQEVAVPPVKKEKKPNLWNAHVKAFRAAHPELSFKQALKDAGATYEKMPK